ncbi:MAG: sugar kinase, partial [Vulcanococcus sp.]
MGWLLADWRWGEEANNLRLALIDAGGCVLAEEASAYPTAFADPDAWRSGVITLCRSPGADRSG